ncbi:hypothetical protein CTAM01_16892 [Colletotrichum tamarilloi]|uniref:Ankyrin repeat protein n=1 Tax=Colletotrichum tamarilloi TaxID=1209934 RepID=A0ABQ9QHI3_9PEZI|nr:uncharacterized protein CTAM01_16892 [Colletotrichum tamarilloi]KAK1470228.1 hypothetical protein CTAM01_16892 [Colletotrichum tamarilloi]
MKPVLIIVPNVQVGRTPLLLAVLYGREAVVRLLLDRDANTEATDEWGRTSLLWAIEKGDEAVVQLLLNHGANTEAADKWGRTSLLTGAKPSCGCCKPILANAVEAESESFDVVGLSAVEKHRNALRGTSTSTIHRMATLRTSRRDGSQARFDVRHRREGGGGSER